MSHSDCFATGPATPQSAEYSSSLPVGLEIGMLSVVNMGEALGKSSRIIALTASDTRRKAKLQV